MHSNPYIFALQILHSRYMHLFDFHKQNEETSKAYTLVVDPLTGVTRGLKN